LFFESILKAVWDWKVESFGEEIKNEEYILAKLVLLSPFSMFHEDN